MRRTAAILVGLLVATSCGGRSDDALSLQRRVASARHISLPDPRPASPAYMASLKHAFSSADIRRLGRAPGVAAVAPLAVKTMRVEGPHERRRLRVGAIDPLAFRPVAPSATRDADFVWTSLIAGKAVITFDAAAKLELDGSGEITLGGAEPVAVGAFADNGFPNLVDVLVAHRVGRVAGVTRPRTAVIGSRPAASLKAVARTIKKRLPAARLDRLAPESLPVPPQQVGHAEGSLIGTMAFRILRNGFIEPDPAWVSANVATGTVPILGTVVCHRIMFPQLGAALHEIDRRGFARLIDVGDYGGCYVPRFVDRNSRKPLSMHAFGLAIDLNVSENHLGTRGNMDPRIVEIFAKWGFVWGGYWGRPDPMHFELARLIEI
jgi:hypothetical protein